MQRKRLFRIGLPLAVNVLLSWVLLPFVIPLRTKFNAQAMTWINRISSAVILVFGVAALGSLLG